MQIIKLCCTPYNITYIFYLKQIPLKQSNKEVESDTESSISFGEVEHIFGFYNVDSNSSVGEIKN